MSPKRPKLKIVLIIIGSLLVLIIGSKFYRIVTWDRLVNHLKTSFLAKDSECELPCWNGIIPGETNINEALTLLELDPKLNSLKPKFEDNEYGKHMSLRPGYFLLRNELGRLELENDIVKRVTLTDEIKMSLSEVLSTFGLPSSVFPVPAGIPEHFYFYFFLFYPDKGLVINIVTDEASSEITPSSRVYYFQLTSKDAIEARIEEVKSYQIREKEPGTFPCNWKGYGDIFDLYDGYMR